MKKKPAKKAKPRKGDEPEENPRAPMCWICNHRHFGVAHVWK